MCGAAKTKEQSAAFFAYGVYVGFAPRAQAEKISFAAAKSEFARSVRGAKHNTGNLEAIEAFRAQRRFRGDSAGARDVPPRRGDEVLSQLPFV